MRLKRAFCKFHRNCRFDDEIGNHALEKARILQGRGGPFSYVVLLSENPAEQLEIVHSAFLKSERCRRKPPVVWGIARTKRGAIRLVARIFAEASRAGMSGEARRFLELEDAAGRGRKRAPC